MRLCAVIIVPVVALYLALAVGNSLAFGYNYFRHRAPHGAADVTANVSLAVFWILELVVLAWAFGALCALMLGNDVSTREALLAGWRQFRRYWWRALPALFLAAAALALVVPGPFWVALCVPVAVNDVAGDREAASGYFRKTYSQHLVVSVPITTVAVAAWLIGMRLRQLSPLPDPVVVLLFVTLGLVITAAVAWTSAAGASIYLLHDEHQRP